MAYLIAFLDVWGGLDPRVRFILGWAAFLWAFWGFYVLVMGFYRAHLDRRLIGVTKVLAAPFVAIGYCMDIFVQLTIANLIFMAPPWRTRWRSVRFLGRDFNVPWLRVEWLVTDRLQRYIAEEGGGVRTNMAEWICTHLLDPFDPAGNHCR